MTFIKFIFMLLLAIPLAAFMLWLLIKMIDDFKASEKRSKAIRDRRSREDLYVEEMTGADSDKDREEHIKKKTAGAKKPSKRKRRKARKQRNREKKDREREV